MLTRRKYTGACTQDTLSPCSAPLLQSQPPAKNAAKTGHSRCRADLKSAGAMASDSWNAAAAADKAEAQQQQQQHQQGWGLGMDEFDRISSSQESSQSTYGSPPPPLTPFAGMQRRALAPSPMKAAPALVRSPLLVFVASDLPGMQLLYV